MKDILFFRLDCDRTIRPDPMPIAGISIQAWRPNQLNLPPPCGLGLITRIAWVIFHHLRIFDNRDYAVVWLREGRACVHRTILFPPFFRFPFMQVNDLQCGDIWTTPSERGRGLATTGLAHALCQAWRPKRRIWYLTDAENTSSVRLASHLGFTLVGHGRRSRRLGLKLFGQFVVTTPLHAIR